MPQTNHRPNGLLYLLYCCDRSMAVYYLVKNGISIWNKHRQKAKEIPPPTKPKSSKWGNIFLKNIILWFRFITSECNISAWWKEMIPVIPSFTLHRVKCCHYEFISIYLFLVTTFRNAAKYLCNDKFNWLLETPVFIVQSVTL